MTDEEIKALAEKDFELYWKVTTAAFPNRFNENIVPFLKLMFTQGYLEGFRKKEEL